MQTMLTSGIISATTYPQKGVYYGCTARKLRTRRYGSNQFSWRGSYRSALSLPRTKDFGFAPWTRSAPPVPLYAGTRQAPCRWQNPTAVPTSGACWSRRYRSGNRQHQRQNRCLASPGRTPKVTRCNRRVSWGRSVILRTAPTIIEKPENPPRVCHTLTPRDCD